MPEEPNPLGDLLRERREAAGLSIRAAAREAGFSEGRWRQLESGYELRQGQRIPVNPKPITIVQAADALGVDACKALALAGIEADLGKIRNSQYTALSKSMEDLKRVLMTGMRPKDRQMEYVVRSTRKFLTVIKNEKFGSLKSLEALQDKLDALEELIEAIDNPSTAAGRDTATLGLSASGEHLTELGYTAETDATGSFPVITSRGEARAPEAVSSGQGTVAPLRGPTNDQLLDRFMDLGLDDLIKLRDLVNGAILASQYPDIEGDLFRASAELKQATEAKKIAVATLRHWEQILAHEHLQVDERDGLEKQDSFLAAKEALNGARHSYIDSQVSEMRAQNLYSELSNIHARIQRFKSAKMEHRFWGER
jgi:transcriptional regulator with XRE-family HTH domain